MEPTSNPQPKRLVQLKRPAKYLVVDSANMATALHLTRTDLLIDSRTTETNLQNAVGTDSILEVNLLQPNSVHKALSQARGVIVDATYLPPIAKLQPIFHLEYSISLALQAGKLVDKANAMSKPLLTPHLSFPHLQGPTYYTLEERAILVKDFISTIPTPVHPAYIVLEGPDGCGKGVQANLLCDYLQEKGYFVLHIREPGKEVGTNTVEEQVRSIILEQHSHMSHIAELMLYQAARAEMVARTFVAEKVDPITFVRNLEPLSQTQGCIIVSERNCWSTIAYQGFGLGISKTLIDELSANAMRGIVPDLGIVINVTPAVGFERMNFANRRKDRIEKRPTEFHEKVYQGYLSVAQREPNAILLEGTQQIQDIHAQITRSFEELIEPYLQELPSGSTMTIISPEDNPHTVSR